MSSLSTFDSGVSGTSRYINREVSWLKFNERVLSEAENLDNPLLERLKFLAIFESNLDEFYMVRVSGLIEQDESGLEDMTPDGLTPAQQLKTIAEVVPGLRQRASDLWAGSLDPELRSVGITVWSKKEAEADGLESLRGYFLESVFPLCTPLLMEPAINFPFISNRSLNLAVDFHEEDGRLARVKIPPNLPRLIPVPNRTGTYVLLEDLIGRNLQTLFPGVKINSWHKFRVIRDADVEIREIEAADLITAVEQSIRLRRFGDPVLLEHEDGLDAQWVKTLRRRLQLDLIDTIEVKGLVGFEFLWELVALDRPDLKFPPFTPYAPSKLQNQTTLFESIRQGDVLVHHPYDSFRSIQEFVSSAADDPKVIGIKATLYRVGAESPIVNSLLAAAEKGKQVAAMVELKARFDESNNLVWSRALERAGVHVTYGFPDMKVHCKLCLIVRQEANAVRTYAHIGTGNYNPVTARSYTDFGLFTCKPDICQDVTEMFNFLTGFSKQSGYRKLLVAPLNLREEIIDKISREIEVHKAQGKGRIMFKLNSLVDPEVIDALYEASRAGIEVKLAVRGICCLKPGIVGLSENVEVVSIVGRYLEHSRAYYFENGGQPEVWIGSADMMRRNLDRRIEVLVPVEDPCHIEYIRDKVLLMHFKDNRRAWSLDPACQYERVRGEPEFELQTYLQNNPALLACP